MIDPCISEVTADCFYIHNRLVMLEP